METWIQIEIDKLQELKIIYKKEKKLNKYLEICSRIKAYEIPNLCLDYIHEPEKGNMCLSKTGLIDCILEHEKKGYNCPNRKSVKWSN